MTDAVRAEIQAFYDRYIAAWNARDFGAMADFHTEPALFMHSEKSFNLPDRAAKIAMLEDLFARLIDEGFSHSVYDTLTVRPSGEGMAIADARNIRRLRSDGSSIEVVDAHYVLRKEGGSWRFIVTVICSPGWRKQRQPTLYVA
ncbi:YybH family protein [Microbaculum marinisediminis]|uniref:Nuclear transport factor 2 family protein n=1 Tax=Microbaculum marinisediminis TaxID=2931392 RepID=A0AAW5R2S5_9HYPH|nr:nuclear transport factor 2 family protein [Microbaculum sp. A6E488]MCT8972845.1 nuclear transport factor 2 family protein [Microbaculum sp. A6E488]